MTIGFTTTIPLLVEDASGCIALLVRHDAKFMADYEADAYILVDPKNRWTDKFVNKLNLEFWRPYKSSITIQNV
jgi:hypothetical protein